MPPKKKARVFISYDYDHDLSLKNLLVGQSRHPDSPFFIEDWSIKEASRSWRSEARERIGRSDVVIVICGRHTNQAVGVGAEIAIAREAGRPYFLLCGYSDGGVRRPPGTWWWETLHSWTRENLRAMTTGKR